MTAVRVVLSTIDSTSEAEKLASRLVEDGLAACVNIIPNLTSVYKWKGEVEREEEVMLVIKTSSEKVAQLTAKLTELHPYELPEVVAIRVEGGFPPYLQWVLSGTSGGEDEKP